MAEIIQIIIQSGDQIRLHSKNAQVTTSLLTSCNNVLQQADIRMRSHGLRQLVTTSLLHVVNRLVASCQQFC